MDASALGRVLFASWSRNREGAPPKLEMRPASGSPKRPPGRPKHARVWPGGTGDARRTSGGGARAKVVPKGHLVAIWGPLLQAEVWRAAGALGLWRRGIGARRRRSANLPPFPWLHSPFSALAVRVYCAFSALFSALIPRSHCTGTAPALRFHCDTCTAAWPLGSIGDSLPFIGRSDGRAAERACRRPVGARICTRLALRIGQLAGPKAANQFFHRPGPFPWQCERVWACRPAAKGTGQLANSQAHQLGSSPTRRASICGKRERRS